MGFGTLAVISLAALAGPLLALPGRRQLPAVLGELAAGVVLGPTVAGYLHTGDATFDFLAEIGFVLIMFVAGSHVPLRDPGMRTGLRVGVGRAFGVAVLSVPVAFGLATLFGTGHTALYAVLMASSSAALILPMVDSLRLRGSPVLDLLPQVALADAACIVALPLVIEPGRAGHAALGALAVLACAVAVFVFLRRLERTGRRQRLHQVSKRRGFALELRISLVVVFALAAIAVRAQVSVMLAGFCLGLAVSAVGEPRRLTKQLFAVTEGFFSPLFFVWLGASLDLRALGSHRSFVLLGLALGTGAVAVHAMMRLVGQPTALGALAAAQLGVPVAAATLGSQLHLLEPGEPAALMLGALVTIAVAGLAGKRATLHAAPAGAPEPTR